MNGASNFQAHSFRHVSISQHGPNLLADWVWDLEFYFSYTGNELRESAEIGGLPSQDVDVSIETKLFSVTFSHKKVYDNTSMRNLATAIMMEKSVDVQVVVYL